MPPEVADILRRLLSPSPSDRPTAQSLLQSLLLPYVPPEEFQPVDTHQFGQFITSHSHLSPVCFLRPLPRLISFQVYDTIARHAFSTETSQIVGALFNRQLRHQLYESTHLEHRLLPDPERVRLSVEEAAFSSIIAHSNSISHRGNGILRSQMSLFV